ncbi:MAG: Ig-like domain-containing protein, partial [Promethearchaeota archaeon]
MVLKWKFRFLSLLLIWLFFASSSFVFVINFDKVAICQHLSRDNQLGGLPSGEKGTLTQSYSASVPPDFIRNASRLARLAGCEVGFYGYADDNRIRNLVGYADYVIIQHAIWSGGSTIKDNVIYLSQHSVKVILDLAWWDVWPFPDAGVYGWRDLDKENVVYGMNATEAVKYRLNGIFSNIDPQYVWAVTISEEEPALGTPSGYDTPWIVPAHYMNYFYDWFKVAYPTILVFQWPSPAEFITQQEDYGYYVKADGIAYDNYDQNGTVLCEIARSLKAQYPDKPLLFLTAATDYLSWGTPHPLVYTKSALLAVAEVADMVGFFCYGAGNLEGWRNPDHQYQIALELCNQTHIHDINTVYADTAWFQSTHNDSITETVDKWYRSAWYGWAEDTKLEISTSSDFKVGTSAINLTQTDIGVGNFWYQPYSHEKYMGYDIGINVDSFDFSTASRISFWIKGVGWENQPDASVFLVFERQTGWYPSYYGNMTLPEVTSSLMDGQWHHVSYSLPLSLEHYQSWNSTACQLRVVANYTGSAISNITTILLDCFDIQNFDNGVVSNLASLNDYAEEVNGTLTIHGSAVFIHNFTTSGPVIFNYAGSGTLEILANDTWHTMPTNNSVLLGVQGFKLCAGAWDWIKFNSLPIIQITNPVASSFVTDIVSLTVNVDDPCGIYKVEYKVDAISKLNLTDASFIYNWNTTEVSETLHTIQAVAYNVANITATHQISIIVDNTIPNLNIITPTQNQRLKNTILVSLSADDVNGINQVEIYIDTILNVTLDSSPWQWYWDTTHTSNAQHILKVIAYDIVGHTCFETVNIIVSNPTAPPPAPFIFSLADIDTNGTFVISWDVTPLVGQEITGYILQMDTDGTFTSLTSQWILNQTYHEVTNLEEESYFFRVQAQDN